jgi:hypothetical protein
MSTVSSAGEPTIELVAGKHPNGELIVEKVLVAPQAAANSYQLLKSPVFVRGIARGDIIQQMPSPQGAFKLEQHSGNLCIRVFGKQPLSGLEPALSAEIEKLGGDIDVCEARVLVYSIHVSCGFNTIEELLNQQLSVARDAAWFYGNVYDPDSGEPLNWWLPILAPE